MGGHEGGETAAAITIDVFDKEFTFNFPRKVNAETLEKWFEQAINKARRAMIKFAKRDARLYDMGTTVAGAIKIGPDLFVYNVGDSRVYLYDGLLTQITKDHNIRNYYIEHYKYTEEQAAMTLGAMALTNALGPTKKTHVEWFHIPLSSQATYVILTTDGIHDYLPKPKFEMILAKKSSLEEKLNEMVKKAIIGKSSDNLTGIIVCLNEEK
ncbi:uncharacterized protein LOC111627201 [Centruroides sculpturatus]|uniref:uncharacterized protein LOC111627201 n=1 Tax=Centruroides sculpturatus TaxID=218467 RepID=UPI000C6DD92B|nr:uncharacterized protein LOC111627201 [Centruroides sculpturatus]